MWPCIWIDGETGESINVEVPVVSFDYKNKAVLACIYTPRLPKATDRIVYNKVTYRFTGYVKEEYYKCFVVPV